MSQPARTGATRATSRPAARALTGPVGTTRRTGPVQVRPQLRLVDAGRPAPRTPGRARSPRSRRAPFVLLVVGLLVVTALSLLALNTATAVDSLQTSTMRAANEAEQQRVDALEQQVITGSTTTRLAQQAAAAGLVPAGVPGHLVVGPDGSSRLEGTPAPAPQPEPAAPTAPPAPAPGATAGEGD